MDKLFFSLIRAGLWGSSADEYLFRFISASEWEALYRMAKAQALIALTFDGIATLPVEWHPPRELYLKWAARTVQVEQANKRHNRMIVRLQALYTRAGLYPVLLKGQGLACNYPNPLHRQCGDIDIYIGKKGQPIANRLLENQGARRSSEPMNKHAGYLFDGVHIENHRILLELGNPIFNIRFRRMVEQWYPHCAETAVSENINEDFRLCPDMPLPPPTFNAAYVFLHAFEHFLTAGVGLRQLCDWVCLLARHHKDIEASVLVRILKDLGMLRAAQAFGYVAVTRLGLPEDLLPFSIKDARKLGEKLLEDILVVGNFGQYDERVKPPAKGYWRRKWHTFRHAFVRSRRLRAFAPLEVFYYPLILIKSIISVQIYKKK